jgi:ubiquinone/menaquinone biosynthesis C-methylase UbiE
MATPPTPPRQDTFFERWIGPFVKTFLIDQTAIKRLADSIDWDSALAYQTNPQVTYPDYYRSQNFHGIPGGYLSTTAALSYDPITQYALPPGEALVRQGLLDAIQTRPRRILDLGCGTGSQTRLLHQRFPDAEIIGLDLSPHMLTVAAHNATALPKIQWRHGNAEHTGLPAASCDLITAALLFHETPPEVAQGILREAFRLLVPGGEILILDGNQKILRQTEWLTQIFEEPYIQAYAAGSTDAWMGAAGFQAVRSQEHYLLHQITHGLKPLPNQPIRFAPPAIDTGDWALGTG